jgi:hypothetical protein
MKFEEGENNFIFVIAPRYPEEHCVTSKFPDFASLFASVFLRVSTLPPSASFRQCPESPRYYTSCHENKADEKLEKTGNKAVLYGYHGAMDERYFHTVRVVIDNEPVFLIVTETCFILCESPIKLCTVNTSQCQNFYRDRIWIGRPVFDLTLYSQHPDVSWVPSSVLP